jgi:uncharacterized protein (DUF2062 family)
MHKMMMGGLMLPMAVVALIWLAVFLWPVYALGRWLVHRLAGRRRRLT